MSQKQLGNYKHVYIMKQYVAVRPQRLMFSHIPQFYDPIPLNIHFHCSTWGHKVRLCFYKSWWVPFPVVLTATSLGKENCLLHEPSPWESDSSRPEELAWQSVFAVSSAKGHVKTLLSLFFLLVSDLVTALYVCVCGLTHQEDLYTFPFNLGPAPQLLKHTRWSISIGWTNEGFSLTKAAASLWLSQMNNTGV